MSDSRRTKLLRAAVEEFGKVHDRWANAKGRENPDESYMEGIEAMFEVFDSGDIPSDCRVLSAAVVTLQDRWEGYLQAREDGQRQYPANEFWEAREALMKSLSKPADDRPVFKPLETMSELRRQNVPDRIIAKIYGLVGENGEAQSHLVQAELDKPGSVIGPDWVDPRILDWKAKQRERESHAEELVEKHRAAAEGAGKEEIPESITDLWEQKVSAKQAARMLGQTVENIQAEFARLDAAKEAGATDETVEMIYALADEKKSAEVIATEMGMKPREVAKILRERPKAEKAETVEA